MNGVTHVLIIQGEPTRPLTGREDASLLDVLREELQIRSASRGCSDFSCGACRVLLDGSLVSACSILWRDVRPNAQIETYEDIATDPAAERAVTAFDAERSTRCRLCVGALGVTAVALSRAGKSGNPESVQDALVGATCMCTGRGSLRRALLRGV